MGNENEVGLREPCAAIILARIQTKIGRLALCPVPDSLYRPFGLRFLWGSPARCLLKTRPRRGVEADAAAGDAVPLAAVAAHQLPEELHLQDAAPLAAFRCSSRKNGRRTHPPRSMQSARTPSPMPTSS